MITKDDVVRGYEHGVVTFCNGDAFGGDGIVCRIGHRGWNCCWFYFAGHEGEEHDDPAEFIDEVGLENALEWVTNTLNNCIREIDEDEYAFYEAVLAECR